MRKFCSPKHGDRRAGRSECSTTNPEKEIHMSTTIETTPQQITALTARPADAPVVMVNLLKFKQPGGLTLPKVRAGSRPAPRACRWDCPLRGTAPAVIIGDGERPSWDAILIVEYPTPAAFIDMVTSEAYAKAHEHRAAALDRGDLIATSTWSVAD